MTDSISIGYSILKDSGELLTFDVEIDDQNQSKPPNLITSDNENCTAECTRPLAQSLVSQETQPNNSVLNLNPDPNRLESSASGS
jgi:hypothetical protein